MNKKYIVKKLEDLVYTKCDRTHVHYWPDTHDITLEYKGREVAEFKNFDYRKFDIKSDVISDDFPLFAMLEDEIETGVLAGFYNRGTELLEEYNNKKYTIKVFKGKYSETLHYRYFTVERESGLPLISSKVSDDKWQTEFTEPEIEELKARDDIAIDWDKAELEEVE